MKKTITKISKSYDLMVLALQEPKLLWRLEKSIYGLVLLSIVYGIGFATSLLKAEEKYSQIIKSSDSTKTEVQALNSQLNKTLNKKNKNYLAIVGKYSNSMQYKRDLVYKLSKVKISKNLSESHLDLMMATADYYSIPYHIYFRIGSRESDNFSSTRSSPKGAMYYFQIMPGTFRNYAPRLGIYKHTATSNIRVSGLIISSLYKAYNGNWEKALAAYNAGEGAVDKYNGVPPYNETRKYVAYVMSFSRQRM